MLQACLDAEHAGALTFGSGVIILKVTAYPHMFFSLLASLPPSTFWVSFALGTCQDVVHDNLRPLLYKVVV